MRNSSGELGFYKFAKDDKSDEIKNIRKRKNYEDSFNSKIYVRSLKANKKELDYFFEILFNHLIAKKTENVYVEMINYLCTNFASYIGIFAKMWNECKVLLCERIILMEFFKQLKINVEILNHFFNCGYDSMETLLTITPLDLVAIQKHNNVTWLPGHAYRLRMVFSKIKDYVDLFFEKNADYIKKIRTVVLKHRKKTKLTDSLVLTENDKKTVYFPYTTTATATYLPADPKTTRTYAKPLFCSYSSPKNSFFNISQQVHSQPPIFFNPPQYYYHYK